MRIAVSVLFLVVILQTLLSIANAQEMQYVLVPTPNSPINTSSGVKGSLQCTKNSDESYGVCASDYNIAIKYNLQPCSFAAKGPNQGNYMRSCDLYETSSQSTSRAVCVKSGNPNGIVYFHRVSDMINVTNVSVGVTGQFLHVIVDTPNQIVYVSNHNNSPAIYKITNIGSSTPIVASTLSSFGSGDVYPVAMIIIDECLYAHFYMNPARLARINISTFTWKQTVTFASGEIFGSYDNLANDNNFIYDLTQNGILVRCTYKNNNFARVDGLATGLTATHSLAISSYSNFLLVTSLFSGILVVNTSTFSIDSRALLPNPTSTGYAQAFGRPLILSENNNTNTIPVCVFSRDNDYLFTFSVSRVPYREAYPTIYPLPSSPINTSSGVVGSLQCTKNSDESYAVCASNSNIAVKYNLQPFSVAAKGLNQGTNMLSCDLYETSSQSTSSAVCVKGFDPTKGVVYFHRVSDMVNVTNVTIGNTGDYPHVIIDTPNQIAYVSNYNVPPAIYKITIIGSSNPIVAGNLTSFGPGDQNPVAMLIIDEFLYIHFYMYPARLARINISSFIWNQTVTFASGESNGNHDNLANDGNYIYDLTQNGIVVRCTYKNNNFARFDSLNTGLLTTYSLVMSPDNQTLFVVSNGNSVLQMINISSFSMFGNTVMVPNALGRPIVMTSRNVCAFSQTTDFVFAFQLSNLGNGNENTGSSSNVSSSSPRTLSSSLAPPSAPTSSHSLVHSTPSLSLIEDVPQPATISEVKSLSLRETIAETITGFKTKEANAETETNTETETSLSVIEAAQPAATETRALTRVNRRQQHETSKTLSLDTDIKIPFIQKISQSVASALVASDATQATAVVSVAIFGSISSSPVLGFNVGRQQAMTNFAKKSLEGDCRGLLPATTVNDFEEQHISNPLGLGDSPTQMSIGGSEKLMSYYVGAVIGDFILTFGLVLLSQGIGMGVMKYFENRKNNSAFGKMVRDRMKINNNKNNKESIFEMMRRVFATSYVSLTLFFCLSILLTPILSSSLIVLVAAMNDPKLKDHEVGVGLKILCIILAVIFCVVAIYFVVWSVFVRNQRKEKYRILKQDEKSQDGDKNIATYLFKAEGEWCYPNPTSSSQQNLANLMKSSKHNINNQRQFTLWYHNFLIAEPTFESYRGAIWFCSVEIISAILLAFPPFFAQFSSSAKGSCLVQGIMLLLILLVYTILLIWKNPFKLRILRIMNPVLAVQQLVIVLISLITAATRSNNHDSGESPAWLWKIIIIPLGFQGVMSFLMIGGAFFPFVMFLRKLKGRISRNDVEHEIKSFGDLRNRRSSRSIDRREDSVEMLPRRNNESRRHHHDGDRRNLRHNSVPSAIPYSNNKNNNENSDRHHHRHDIVRRNNFDERETRSSWTNNNNNNISDRNKESHHHRHENNHEMPRRTLSGESLTRRSSRNNSNHDQRERERCARTLNISPTSLLSPRREHQNHSREQANDKVQDKTRR